MKKCPYCAEEIQQDAIKCKYCSEWLTNRKERIAKSRPKIDLTQKQQRYIDSFSFAAMFGIPWWSLYMKYYNGLLWTILLFIPFTTPIVAIIFGGFARRLAWKNYGWQSFEEFHQRSKKIDTFCVGLIIVSVCVSFLIYVFIAGNTS